MKKMVFMGIGSLGLVLLAGFMTPLVLRSARNPRSIQALGNARQIGLALMDFESDYGKFPDASTIPALKSMTATDWDLKDKTSNDLFKQLFAAGIMTSEEVFYTRTPGGRKPDNVIAPNNKILERGECGFAYIPGGSSKINPSTPVVVAPLIPGTLKFDPTPFDGMAIVLRADGSVIRMRIESDGRVLTREGKDLFDPKDSYWNGVSPDVKWPDL